MFWWRVTFEPFTLLWRQIWRSKAPGACALETDAILTTTCNRKHYDNRGRPASSCLILMEALKRCYRRRRRRRRHQAVAAIDGSDLTVDSCGWAPARMKSKVVAVE